MSAKPATSQVCNTQSYTECWSDGGNLIYAVTDCTTDIWWMWDGNDISFDQHARHPFTKWIGGYKYYTTSGYSCYCDLESYSCYNMRWNICRSSA